MTARDYRLLDRGAWKGFYDAAGRIAVVEYDSNGDGRADYIAHYDERRQIRLIEVDEDLDSWVDRFEHYDAAGVLEKVGRWRQASGPRRRVDLPRARRAAGADRVRRRRRRQAGARRGDAGRHRSSRIETDSDRDGRVDRWQSWEKGRLVSEEIDTNGDGKPDRRLVFGPRARLLRVERLPK